MSDVVRNSGYSDYVKAEYQKGVKPLTIKEALKEIGVKTNVSDIRSFIEVNNIEVKEIEASKESEAPSPINIELIEGNNSDLLNELFSNQLRVCVSKQTAYLKGDIKSYDSEVSLLKSIQSIKESHIEFDTDNVTSESVKKLLAELVSKKGSATLFDTLRRATSNTVSF